MTPVPSPCGRSRPARAIVPALLLPALLLQAPPAAAETGGRMLRIGGSGAPMTGMAALAEEYHRQTGLPPFTFQPTSPIGSGGGVKALLAGSLELALASRPLTREEQEAGATATFYAVTPFLLAAPTDRSYPGLTLDGFARILTGEVMTWPDGRPIRLVMRPATDTDTIILRQFSAPVARALEVALSREGMVFANNDLANTERLEATPGSLGITTLAQLVAERRSLAPLPLGGVTPTLETLERGTWRWRKEFFAVLGPSSPPEARAFVRWLASPQAGPALRRLGMAPP